MQIRLQTSADIAAPKVCRVTKLAYDAAVQHDLEFLRAWEDGQFPELCRYLRVRQIRTGRDRRLEVSKIDGLTFTPSGSF